MTVTSELTRRSRKGKEKEKRGEGDTQGSGLRARQTQGGPHSPEIPTPIMMIMFMTMSARDKKARWGDGEYGRLYEVAGRAWQQRYSWPLPALSHWDVKVGGTSREEMRGFDASSKHQSQHRRPRQGPRSTPTTYGMHFYRSLTVAMLRHVIHRIAGCFQLSHLRHC